MANAILTNDVRDVYWKYVHEYSFKVEDREYTVRVSEDSNSMERLWLSNGAWLEEGHPEEVGKFFDQVQNGYVDQYAGSGEEVDLDQE